MLNIVLFLSNGVNAVLINKTYKDQLKKVEIDYINLDSVYINKDNISLEDLKKHVEKNKEKFSVEIISPGCNDINLLI